MDLFIDFSDAQEGNTVKEETEVKYEKEYDHFTSEFLKALRLTKTDPITFDNLNDDNAFIFKNMWNPYTGEILKGDPFGGIYFSPVSLLRHYYSKRLENLWVDHVDENGNIYEGYYGDSVGIGEDFEVVSRGCYPERYLFRLPITTAYLPIDYDRSIITMGPKLSTSDIRKIDELLKSNYWKNNPYVKKIYKKIGSLLTLKQLYDIAIHKKPSTIKEIYNINIFSKKDAENSDNPDVFINRTAVNLIKKM